MLFFVFVLLFMQTGRKEKGDPLNIAIDKMTKKTRDLRRQVLNRSVLRILGFQGWNRTGEKCAVLASFFIRMHNFVDRGFKEFSRTVSLLMWLASNLRTGIWGSIEWNCVQSGSPPPSTAPLQYEIYSTFLVLFSMQSIIIFDLCVCTQVWKTGQWL